LQARERQADQAESLARSGDYGAARRIARKMQADNPADTSWLIRRLNQWAFSPGYKALRDQRWANAIEEFRKGLLDWPNNAYVHARLGDALVAQARLDDPLRAEDRLEEAAAEYRSALYYDTHNENSRESLEDINELMNFNEERLTAERKAEAERDVQASLARKRSETKAAFERFRNSDVLQTLVVASLIGNQTAAPEVGRNDNTFINPKVVINGYHSQGKLASDLVWDTPVTASRKPGIPYEPPAPPATDVSPEVLKIAIRIGQLDVQLEALQKQALASNDPEALKVVEEKSFQVTEERARMKAKYAEATSFQLAPPKKARSPQ
jgi:tetratricopeptide (TPR) repeat protein